VVSPSGGVTDAIEMYYNMAITPWLNLTSDLQIVDSGLNKAISPTTGKLTGIDTVVVAGARLAFDSRRSQHDRRIAAIGGL
jgi:hypothetical protein